MVPYKQKYKTNGIIPM